MFNFGHFLSERCFGRAKYYFSSLESYSVLSRDEADGRGGGCQHDQHDELRDGVAAPGHEGGRPAGAQSQGRDCDRVCDPPLGLLHLPHSPGIQQAPQ